MYIYIYTYIYNYMQYMYTLIRRRPGDMAVAFQRRPRAVEARPTQSYTSKGIWRQGMGSFCKEFLRFNTMPRRHLPLLVHFWLTRARRGVP